MKFIQLKYIRTLKSKIQVYNYRRNNFYFFILLLFFFNARLNGKREKGTKISEKLHCNIITQPIKEKFNKIE